jgi:hypothetical protein
MRHDAAHMTLLPALASVALLAGAFAPAARAEFGVAKWEAQTCNESTCADAGSHSAFYTQAAGHPGFGITDFAFGYTEVLGAKEPDGNVKDVRVDLPPGLGVNPEATGTCTEAQLDAFKCPAESQVGVDEATGTAELTLGVKTTVKEEFKVYNMERKFGEPARFGVEINSTTLKAAETLLGHHLTGELYLEGGISWHREAETSESSGVQTGDYHEFFKIQNIPKEPEVVESRLIFWGVPHEHNAAAPNNTFLTTPSAASDCADRQITYLHVDSYEDPGHFLKYANETPIVTTGCNSLEFNPSLTLLNGAGEEAPGQSDGAEVRLRVPQYTTDPSRPDSPDLKTAQVTLPEGMTLNPSAARELQACTNEQFGSGCPGASQIGTFTVDAPGIPDNTLDGSIYLANQENQEPESGGEFRFFLAGEATAFGVGVRLEGRVSANSHTGQLTATVNGSPQVQFEDFILHFRGGPRAPLANPLLCAPAPQGSLTSYTGQPAASTPLNSPFTPGAGSVCATSAPFSLSQSTQSSSSVAGAHTFYTFDLARADGEEYLARVNTVLPLGLLGDIPSVPLCGEPQAAQGACPVSSLIGTATVTAGAGSEPYPFSGSVFLTGPYDGAPYGLSIPIAVVAGPFDFGTVVTRASISVDPHTARAIVSTPPSGTPGALPSIVDGVPVRLRTLSVAVTRPNFLFNPTDCGALATESALTSTLGATQRGLSSPFQVGDCGALAFKPSFKATTAAKTSKLRGASLQVSIVQPAHEANIASVYAQLPPQLPSRLSTLQKACPEATFAANPVICRALGSEVGSATVHTPVLPGALSGSAYLVSHGGVAFPDLDIVLEGDGGVRVILTGNTDIKHGITSATFASVPDVPISSFVLTLPVGPHSALAANGSLCKHKLTMPTTIVAQNGVRIEQNTKISVFNCPVAIVGHRVVGHKLILKVRTFAAGRVSVTGKDLRTVHRRVTRARTVTLTIPLSRGGLSALARHGRLKIRVRVGFAPKQKHAPSSIAHVTVTFR